MLYSLMLKKLRNTASHKGFIFSTSGFQRGALDVAVEEGIATLIFEAGNARYETRSMWYCITTLRIG